MRQLIIAFALVLAASTVFAQDAQKPSLWIQELTTDICHERPYMAAPALFNCQEEFGIDVSERLLPSQQGSVLPHAAMTKFSLLAGKFMGRVDAVTFGQWRFRFVVILK